MEIRTFEPVRVEFSNWFRTLISHVISGSCQTRFAPATFIGVISSRPRLTKSNHSFTFSDSRWALRKKDYDDQSASLSYRYCDYSALLFYCLCEYKKECSEWPTRHVWRRHWRYDAQTSNTKYQRRSWFLWRFLWCSRRWIVSRSVLSLQYIHN